MDVEKGEYRLRCQLHGHEDDVRGICICGDRVIATSSRDRTIRLWTLSDSSTGNAYVFSKILEKHTSFVGPLAWFPPNESLPQGGIVSGGMDTMVLLWDISNGEVVYTMRGHKAQVTSLAVDENGDILSTSMDCTIKRWRSGREIESWEAHKTAIQTVLKLPSGDLVTGSSDSTLKIWSGKSCTHTFKGHKDTVRDLALMPKLGILSASHDCSIRLWTLTGQGLMEMISHTSLIYSVDAHASGHIASGSEDQLLKIWKNGNCLQSIEHPGCVWATKFLDNGDIVTGCSDGIVRIWTSCSDRVADDVEINAYESLISERTLSRMKVGGIKLSELPGLEALKVPGTKDGQTLIIREGVKGVAYSWNSSEKNWDKIGEVVDGPEGSSSRPVINGTQYDYVFDVDIGDGEPIRKLPYNRTENPYTTADNWLLKENLPLSYREQVVQFILQNSGQNSSDFSLDTSFHDPYTGSSAYVPEKPSAPTDAYKRPAFKHIPKKGFLFFETAQFDGILKKITEFNKSLSIDLKRNNLSLTNNEFTRITAIISILKDSSHYHVSTFADVDIALLLKVLKSWPLEILFPVIDIVRMLTLHPDGSSLLLKHMQLDNEVIMEVFRKVTEMPALTANVLIFVRAISNFFRQTHFNQWLLLNCSEILDRLAGCRSSFSKNLHLSYSTLILNYTVLLIDKKDEQSQGQMLTAAMEIVEDVSQDIDSKFRALVAIGSLMFEGFMKSRAIGFDILKVARTAKDSKEGKISEVGADIELLVQTP